jgi:CRP-like cAMP-binding protein
VVAALPAAECNTLLGSLPRRERDPLLSLCEPIELKFGEVLCKADKPYRHAFFPTSGLISLVSGGQDHNPLEMALIGQEGMLGATLLLGIGTVPIQAVVHAPGVALRITAEDLRGQIRESKSLRKVLNRYLYMRLVELSLVGGCIRYHRIEQRLARALLLAHDRVQADYIYLTHRSLAEMLGVRRSSVTLAAGDLQDRKLISYSRGGITILDRPGLEAMSCDCYQVLHARQKRNGLCRSH